VGKRETSQVRTISNEITVDNAKLKQSVVAAPWYIPLVLVVLMMEGEKQRMKEPLSPGAEVKQLVKQIQLSLGKKILFWPFLASSLAFLPDESVKFPRTWDIIRVVPRPVPFGHSV
jgi:hypothetical protein